MVSILAGPIVVAFPATCTFAERSADGFHRRTSSTPSFRRTFDSTASPSTARSVPDAGSEEVHCPQCSRFLGVRVRERIALWDGRKGELLQDILGELDGIRVVDVWESREVFDRFAQEQIGPYTREVGFESGPETRFYEVHNYFTPGS